MDTKRRAFAGDDWGEVAAVLAAILTERGSWLHDHDAVRALARLATLDRTARDAVAGSIGGVARARGASDADGVCVV